MEFYARNAASGEQLEPGYRDVSGDELSAVCKDAARAAGSYGALPQTTRADFLESVAEEIEAAAGDIIARAHVETGLPAARLETEKNRTANQLRSFANLLREGSWVDARIDTARPDRKPLPRPDIRRMLRPLGPVAVFGASNFPLAFSVAGGDTASALAAGNPVVVKAHPAHPGTSDLTAKAVLAAAAKRGIPGGVFAMVHGASPDVSLSLVSDPAISAVGFTGSHRAGRALLDAAARRPVPIPVFAEMSSVNPIFLLPGALRESGTKIADDFVASFTMGVGQFCTKPGLVFGLKSPEWEDFCSRVASVAQGIPAGVMLHEGIADTFKKSVTGLRDLTWLSKGPVFAARTDSRSFEQRPELSQEIFGPFALLIGVEDEQELVSIAAGQQGQLTASVFNTAADGELAQSLLTELAGRAGRLLSNGFPTGVEVVSSMTHGGPYPASTDARFTSVGTAAILRFARPVSYQNLPDELLPPELQNANPKGILRLVDGTATREPVPV